MVGGGSGVPDLACRQGSLNGRGVGGRFNPIIERLELAFAVATLETSLD
jgi:hypothetical protein